MTGPGTETTHSIGPLGTEAVALGCCGYRHPYVIRCRCGWRVRGHDIPAVSKAALDHVTGRVETHVVAGFAPWLDLDLRDDLAPVDPEMAAS